MNKATLTMLASTSLFAVLVLIAHPANAAGIAFPVDRAVSVQVVRVGENPMLNVSREQGNPILDQLGCNCATCTSSRRQQLQGSLPF